jgi:protein-tyrosine phosphatase
MTSIYLDSGPLQHPQRRLTCENIFNARDLGGLRGDGFMLHYGHIIRGESTAFTKESDHRYLKNYGLKHIFDLRTVEEAEVVGHGTLVNYLIHSHPLVKSEEFKNNSISKVSRTAEYQQYFANSHPIVNKLILLLNSNSGGVYLHCAVGKDRTGVITAILLKLLEINDKEIMYDYLESKHHIKPIIESLASFSIYSDFQNVNWLAQEPVAGNLLPILKNLRTPAQRELYLSQADLHPDDIITLKNLLLRPLV